jgi:hypothetical protein
MAHFAEIDSNGIVLRVVVGCNIDIANNGGEQSIQAAEHFKKICPLSENGVKWVQTSYNKNFRKKYAGKGDFYDEAKDKFILPKPYNSWSLNSNDDWTAPVKSPDNIPINEQGIEQYRINWDEDNQRWLGTDKENNSIFIWAPANKSWISLS